MNADVLKVLKELVEAVKAVEEQVRRINDEGVVVINDAGINEN